MARRAIRVCDLADEGVLEQKLEELLLHHNALRRGFGVDEIDGGALLVQLRQLAPLLLPFAEPVWLRLSELRRAGRRILFEGAQGAMLDVDHGTYPFVTSSNTTAGMAATGSGVGPDTVGYVLGITKAYTTRVGSGPFPTELFDETGNLLGERGHEFGTVTGRKRRCGWFDAVLVRQAVKTGGIRGLALTKLDVLDGFEQLEDLHRLQSQRPDAPPFAGGHGGPGRRQADLRGDRGLVRQHAPARAASPTCRPRRSSTSSGWRSWSRRR